MGEDKKYGRAFSVLIVIVAIVVGIWIFLRVRARGQCREGWSLTLFEGKWWCVNDLDPTRIEPATCPEGMVWSATLGRCVYTCPPGEERSEGPKICVRSPPGEVPHINVTGKFVDFAQGLPIMDVQVKSGYIYHGGWYETRAVTGADGIFHIWNIPLEAEEGRPGEPITVSTTWEHPDYWPTVGHSKTGTENINIGTRTLQRIEEVPPDPGARIMECIEQAQPPFPWDHNFPMGSMHLFECGPARDLRGLDGEWKANIFLYHAEISLCGDPWPDGDRWALFLHFGEGIYYIAKVESKGYKYVGPV